jgi:hypothetical protein
MAKNANTTVKKPARKKSAKAVAKPMSEIWILPGNPPTVVPSSVALDPNGSKHPPQVYWQAQDPTLQYQITFPASPFKKPGPFVTGTDGSTALQTVDPSSNDGSYVYTIAQISPGPVGGVFVTPGGGIIIES